MIHLDEENGVAMVRGIFRKGALDKAIRKAAKGSGRKPSDWLIICLPPEDGIQGIHTSMPFSPPDDGRYSIGYKVPE